MVSVITGNAQNTPIGENIELAGENPEELKVIYVNKDVPTHFIAMEDIKYVDILLTRSAMPSMTTNWMPPYW